MNELQIFENNEFGKVRTIEENGNILFCGSDVAKALGYAIPHKAVNDHCKGVLKRNIPTNGGNQEILFITEGDVYRLIVRSKLPSAEKFESWVFDEVLPSIRKHGAYVTDNVMEQILGNPDFGIKLLSELKTEREKRTQMEKQIQQDKPKVLFAEALEISQSSILVGEMAKLLARNGLEDMGQNRFFKWLRDNGYLHKHGEQYNLPTQYSTELGLMEVKTTTLNNPDGSVRVTKTPKIMAKGQIYFVDKFKERATA